jgi:catalase
MGKASASRRKRQLADEMTADGGELCLQAVSSDRHMSTNQGLPVADDQNSLKVAVRESTLPEGFHLCETVTHFEPDRIPGFARRRRQ